MADFLAEVLLSKGAGDFDRYIKCCKLQAHFIPSNEIVYFYRTWFNQDPPDIEDAYEIAKEMFILETRYKGGKHLFAGCSFDEKAIRMQCVRVEDVSVKIDTTKELSDDEARYWLGPIANGSYRFFVPEVSIEDVVRKYGSVLWVDFQIIVKTRDEDMYPLRIRLWHHPDMNQWIIDAVTRQSTIRGAASSPSLVF